MSQEGDQGPNNDQITEKTLKEKAIKCKQEYENVKMLEKLHKILQRKRREIL